MKSKESLCTVVGVVLAVSTWKLLSQGVGAMGAVWAAAVCVERETCMINGTLWTLLEELSLHRSILTAELIW